MVVYVKRDNVVYPCKTEEQLKVFLAAGYTEVETEKPKAAVKKTTKK